MSRRRSAPLIAILDTRATEAGTALAMALATLRRSGGEAAASDLRDAFAVLLRRDEMAMILAATLHAAPDELCAKVLDFLKGDPAIGEGGRAT